MTKTKKKKRSAAGSSTKTAGISDEAVKAKTGKDWKQWCAALDKAGGKTMNHKEIVAVLHEKHGLDAWWSQMVTVGYEQARGMRQKHEKPHGYDISVSRTMDVPVAKLYKAFKEKRIRARWLSTPEAKGEFTIRTATADKSMRVDWVDGATRLSIDFYDKGASKSQVVVQHIKLSNATDAARMKKYWAGQLLELKSTLESR